MKLRHVSVSMPKLLQSPCFLWPPVPAAMQTPEGSNMVTKSCICGLSAPWHCCFSWSNLFVRRIEVLDNLSAGLARLQTVAWNLLAQLLHIAVLAWLACMRQNIARSLLAQFFHSVLAWLGLFVSNHCLESSGTTSSYGCLELVCLLACKIYIEVFWRNFFVYIIVLAGLACIDTLLESFGATSW